MMTDPEKSRSQAVWGAKPAGSTHAPHLRPGTREFFDTARERRLNHEIPWLPRIVPFSSAAGKRVLEIGCGAGFDAFEFCRHGAEYWGVDITPENPIRTREHLKYYGFEPQVAQADAEDLPFPDDSFDIVFSNGVLHHTPDIRRALREAYRVLGVGGTAWIIVYHRDSAFYWFKLWLVDHILGRGYRECSFRERLARVEFTTSDLLPLVNVYGRRELRSLLAEAGFNIRGTWVRKLLREDLPSRFYLWTLWRAVPQAVLRTIGMAFGWYLIAEAAKE